MSKLKHFFGKGLAIFLGFMLAVGAPGVTFARDGGGDHGGGDGGGRDGGRGEGRQFQLVQPTVTQNSNTQSAVQQTATVAPTAPQLINPSQNGDDESEDVNENQNENENENENQNNSPSVNQAPTIVASATANPNPVTGTSTALSVLAADDQGEANLTYTWSTTGKPTGATDPTFSVNGNNAAKNTIATFSQFGTYQFTVTATDQGVSSTTSVQNNHGRHRGEDNHGRHRGRGGRDGGDQDDDDNVPGTVNNGPMSVTSTVTVTVNQTFTKVTVSPSASTVIVGQTQQFTAAAVDQFNAPITSSSITWSVAAGGPGGTINNSGLYTAPSTTGTDTVTASTGSASGSAQVTVVQAPNAAPTIVNEPTANPNPVTGPTTTLSVLGADDHGEAALTYLWSVSNKPAGAADPTFSINNSNAAKTTVATFSQAGSYEFKVTITDAGFLSVTSSVLVNVNQTPTTITVSPTSTAIASSTTAQFTATSSDQFGTVIPSPTFIWSVLAGGIGGTINGTGLYTAPTSTTGIDTINVSFGTADTTAHVTVF